MQEEEALLTIYPLGGYGEIGMNCTLLETAQGCVLLDCGLMFPEDYHLGVDVVIPRFDLIVEKAELTKQQKKWLKDKQGSAK